MTATQLIEHRIARQLLQRRSRQAECADEDSGFHKLPAVQSWVDRLIAVLAVTICLVVVGSFAEELLWAILAAATAFALRD